MASQSTVRKYHSVPQSDVHPKVAAGGLAGACMVVAAYAASQFGFHPPIEVVAAATLIVSTLAGYLKKS
jgi:hypothetical protein